MILGPGRSKKSATRYRIVNGVEEKRCGAECEQWKPNTFAHYPYTTSEKKGLRSNCKACLMKRSIARRSARRAAERSEAEAGLHRAHAAHAAAIDLANAMRGWA